MSTPNFCNRNASKVFAVTWDESENDWAYDDLKTNLRSELRAKLNAWETDDWENMNRSYEGKIIARCSISPSSKWLVTFDAIVRNAYYDGVNLDWNVHIENVQDPDSEVMTMDEAGKLPRYVTQAIDAQVKKIEAIYAQFSTPLRHVATFSNGEAIYEKY